ncbi:hypothetical protein [Streptomyces sp. NK08204]|uniref:hypothetical protein n=1 Tax=Streptomyces sp. NK08204 TaxID=2873260 RepID=UPI001CECA5D4|nr:hypothetical protein [Streptomyces sp. NK08204]
MRRFVMRCRFGGCAVVAMVTVVVLAGCGAPAGQGAGGGPSGARPVRPSSQTPSAASSAGPAATSASAPAQGCASGPVEVVVSPGDPVRRALCVRPGAVLTLVLHPRVDDKRWVDVHSSAPALVLPTGWQVQVAGGARATLRCAGTRGGSAEVTVTAKAPDVAGAARPVFTLDVTVVPYPQNG